MAQGSKALQKEADIRQRMAEKRAKGSEERKAKQRDQHVRARPRPAGCCRVIVVGRVWSGVWVPQLQIRAKYGLTLTEPETGEQAMCGWLLKRGKVNKAFKKRWFRLDASGAIPQMRYYTDVDGEEKGAIDLSLGCKATLCTSPDSVDELHVLAGDCMRTFVLRSEAGYRRHLIEWQQAIESELERQRSGQ